MNIEHPAHDVENFQIFPHLSQMCSISDISTFAMYRNLKFLHMTDFSPHVNFVTNMRYGGKMLTPFFAPLLFLVLKNSSIMQHIWTFNIFFHQTDSFIDLSFFLVCIALPPVGQVSKRIEETYCLQYKRHRRQNVTHIHIRLKIIF